jgi:hypothetical protein
MSPLKKLKIGETIEHDIAWELFQLPTEITDPSEKIISAAKWLKSTL